MPSWSSWASAGLVPAAAPRRVTHIATWHRSDVGVVVLLGVRRAWPPHESIHGPSVGVAVADAFRHNGTTKEEAIAVARQPPDVLRIFNATCNHPRCHDPSRRPPPCLPSESDGAHDSVLVLSCHVHQRETCIASFERIRRARPRRGRTPPSASCAFLAVALAFLPRAHVPAARADLRPSLRTPVSVRPFGHCCRRPQHPPADPQRAPSRSRQTSRGRHSRTE